MGLKSKLKSAIELNISLGILVCGPSGSGKTKLIQNVCLELGLEVVTVTICDEDSLETIFQNSKKKILVLDNLDELCPKRDENKTKLLGRLLCLMDGYMERSLIVFGTTTNASKIDPAIRRPGRFDMEIKVTPVKNNVKHAKFDLIAGLDEVKRLIQKRVIDPFVNPQKYKKFGLNPPKGLLLHGPPGCSKTTFARYLGLNMGFNFVSLTAAEIYSSYVGESASKLREVFWKSRLKQPTILFLDEIDVVLGSRDKKDDVQMQVLCTLLTEMDGIEQNTGVLVVATANDVTKIDSALLRPGRFDHVCYLPMPEKQDRKKIWELYLNKHNLDIEKLSEMELSGAEIKAKCQEAAISCIRRQGTMVTNQDFK